VAALVLVDGRAVIDTPPDGRIASGRTLELVTPLTTDPGAPVQAAVTCSDQFGRTHGWLPSGKHKRWSRRRVHRHQVTNFDVFAKLVSDFTPTQVLGTRPWLAGSRGSELRQPQQWEVRSFGLTMVYGPRRRPWRCGASSSAPRESA